MNEVVLTGEMQIRDRRNGQWSWVNNAVFAAPHLTSAEKVIYAALATFAGCHEIRPSVPTIAQRSGTGDRTVQLALRKLKQVGYIRIEHQKNGTGSNIYYLLKAAKGCLLCRAPRKECTPVDSAPVQGSADNPRKILHETRADSAPEIDNQNTKKN